MCWACSTYWSAQWICTLHLIYIVIFDQKVGHEKRETWHTSTGLQVSETGLKAVKQSAQRTCPTGKTKLWPIYTRRLIPTGLKTKAKCFMFYHPVFSNGLMSVWGSLCSLYREWLKWISLCENTTHQHSSEYCQMNKLHTAISKFSLQRLHVSACKYTIANISETTHSSPRPEKKPDWCYPHQFIHFQILPFKILHTLE